MYKKDTEINTVDKEIQLDYISIKKKLKKAREDKKLTQTQLAEIAGVPQGRISTCLNEDNSDFFTFEQMYKICSALKLSIDELVGLNKDISQTSTKLDPGIISSMIANICKNNMYGMEFKNITVEEFRYASNHDESFVNHDEKEKCFIDYPAIYFSENTSLIQNENAAAIAINDFLVRLKRYTELYDDALIGETDYHTLIDSALGGVLACFYDKKDFT